MFHLDLHLKCEHQSLGQKSNDDELAILCIHRGISDDKVRREILIAKPQNAPPPKKKM